jgi:hypothetical protein
LTPFGAFYQRFEGIKRRQTNKFFQVTAIVQNAQARRFKFFPLCFVIG